MIWQLTGEKGLVYSMCCRADEKIRSRWEKGGEAQVRGMRWLQGRWEWQNLEWKEKYLRASGGEVRNNTEGAWERLRRVREVAVSRFPLFWSVSCPNDDPVTETFTFLSHFSHFVSYNKLNPFFGTWRDSLWVCGHFFLCDKPFQRPADIQPGVLITHWRNIS